MSDAAIRELQEKIAQLEAALNPRLPRKRSDALTTKIIEAVRKTRSRQPAVVFAELRAMAARGETPFASEASDGVIWNATNGVRKLTLNFLLDRLNRTR